MADISTPIIRVGYSPVYKDDDDSDSEHPRSESPLSLLSMPTASTLLLPQQNNTIESQSTGVTAASRRRLKAKWRREAFFRSIGGILGDSRDGGRNRKSAGQLSEFFLSM